ncbi:MAG: carbohydrate ABC transporter permease, partial [Ruthenibacterium sp.]
ENYAVWPFLPQHPTFAPIFELLFDTPEFFIMFWNTVRMAFPQILGQIFVGAPAAWAFSRLRFPCRKFLFGLYIILMLLPFQVTMVPNYLVLNGLHLLDTVWAVILPAVGWPFGVFLMKQFSETIPSELLEAAKIDGCSELITFVRIVIPMVKPGIAALAIFKFIEAWNDYFLQLIMLSSRSNLTLQIGIATMQAEFATNYGVLMAGATFSAIPIVTVFVLFQKSFTQGITMGAVKG